MSAPLWPPAAGQIDEDAPATQGKKAAEDAPSTTHAPGTEPAPGTAPASAAEAAPSAAQAPSTAPACLPDCLPDKAEYFMRELAWGEHFIGVEMGSASGNREVYLYSLGEAGQYLRGGGSNPSFLSTGSGGIVSFDIHAFINWVQVAVGDDDLACALTNAQDEEQSFTQRAQAIGLLVNKRLVQLMRLSGIETVGD